MVAARSDSSVGQPQTCYHGDNMVAARSDSFAGQPQRLGVMETTWTLPALTHDWYNEIELMT